MKTFMLLAAIAGTIGFLAYRQSEKLNPSDPVKAMELRMAGFPQEVHFGAEVEELRDVSFNVRKTDSLSAPIVGIVGFTEPAETGYDTDKHFELIFHWRHGGWEFERSLCTNTEYPDVWNGRPLSSQEIKSWIVHGRVIHDAPPLESVPQATPEPRPQATPRPTPSPAQVAAEIERKYGAPR